ncbi:DUF4118 domain-containing protein [Agitococcus lubricus]|uniref:histidine kinase n=1 Tax=Agitococcus lubricus TaxID=1077255 RepID=A0A2T5J1C0_9GAMM|nr:DUF4118 domain-containing protein [Agitococcus lubricus]PTQ90188.1 two-component system sensor histidine kinase KdpD [Agitococcus lubricus]
MYKPLSSRLLAISCVIIMATLLFSQVFAWLSATNIAMLYLLMVMMLSAYYGRQAGIFSAVLAVLAFDFFFVEPRLSFSVEDWQYLITFAVMLISALTVSQLINTLRDGQQKSDAQAEQNQQLYLFAKQLVSALTPQDIFAICQEFIETNLALKVAFYLSPNALANSEEMIFGDFTEHEKRTLTRFLAQDLASANMFYDADNHYFPLKGQTRLRGMMRIINPQAIAKTRLETIASLVAVALERWHYIDVSEQQMWQIKSEQLRNSILSAVSHDIRTPLTIIYGLADQLSTELRDSTHQDRIRQICQHSLHLNKMVSSLLELSKLQSGHVVLKWEWLPVEELIGSALQELKPLLHKHPIVLPQSLDAVIYGDELLLQRVISNLLDNAIKYCQGEGEIKIGVKSEADTFYLSIANPAPLMTHAQLTHIFTPFQRLAHTSHPHGIGLGLAICQQIIHAHHGDISCHCETAPDSQQSYVVMTIRLPTPLQPQVPS